MDLIGCAFDASRIPEEAIIEIHCLNGEGRGVSPLKIAGWFNNQLSLWQGLLLLVFGRVIYKQILILLHVLGRVEFSPSSLKDLKISQVAETSCLPHISGVFRQTVQKLFQAPTRNTRNMLVKLEHFPRSG